MNPRLALLVLFSVIVGCSKPAKLDAVKAVKADVELTVSSVTSGTVNAEKEARLAFGAVGRVARLNVHVDSIVNAGDILAEIENQDLRAILHHAEHDLKRAQSLTQSNLMAAQENERARQAFETAQGNYDKSIIRAPFDGLITEVNLEVGELSQITAISPKALLRIVDLKPRYISADIDEVDLSRVERGMPVRVKILAVRREPFAGSVRLVIPFVSTVREQDRTSRVEITVDSGSTLLPPGASADVEIIAAQHKDVLAIPTRTLLGRGSNRFVYVDRGGNAEKVAVTIGIGNYDRTEIVSGLSPGDIVLLPSDEVDLSVNPQVKSTVFAWP